MRAPLPSERRRSSRVANRKLHGLMETWLRDLKVEAERRASSRDAAAQLLLHPQEPTLG